MKYIESTQKDIEQVAKEIADRQGYIGEEANIYERGVSSGYERALEDNSKAINMHDELVKALKKANEYLENREVHIAEFTKLLKQAEHKI